MSKKWFWMVFVFLFLIILVGVGGYLFIKITSFQHVTIDQSDEALGIQIERPEEEVNTSQPTPSTEEGTLEENKWENKIINIALFGVDRRKQNERGRSDAIIVLTTDFKHHKIKLSSFMRDLEVSIEGHGKTKLNHAYAYGGAPLAIKTINQNFGLDIRDYATVDFFTLAKIIDAIGGVELDIEPGEIKHINKYIKEVADIEKTEPAYLETSGMQTLNGMQAVAYARIRSYGNGDFERTERQRQVLTLMIEKVKSKGVSAIPSLLMKISPYVETSLDRSDILSMAYQYFKYGNMTIEQQRFPLDGTWKSGYNNAGGWVLRTDMDELKNTIQKYIYDDISPGNPQSNL